MTTVSSAGPISNIRQVLMESEKKLTESADGSPEAGSSRQHKRRQQDKSGSVPGDRHGRDIVDRDAEDSLLNGQRKLLDLESIAYQQGLLLKTNKMCELPPGSSRKSCDDYEEVYVPALKAEPFAEDEKLVKISAMPNWAQPAFAGMTQLNRVQSRVYEAALINSDNVLVCAPTGAGKTVVALLTILQQLRLHMNEDGTFNHSDYKIVYVAPMQSRVAEVVGNLSARLKPYGVTVMEPSGDRSLTQQQIDETQIIVTTPERWDMITRKSGDRIFTPLVKLLIIDEIHLLHDNRGPVLESIVARYVRKIETTEENIRLIGLSATLSDYVDVARFMRVDLKNGIFHFDNTLAQHYIGITGKNPSKRFQLMNDICYEKVLGVAGKYQVLIFVHSNEETTTTANAIRNTAIAEKTLRIFLKDNSPSWDTNDVKNNDLKDLLPHGFAIHNSGMTVTDRQLVKTLFAEGQIQVLVSTAALAWELDLCAHTVIVKGTQIYNPEKGKLTELSHLDVMQMLGRAGRPQIDTYCDGIIITGHSELQYYLSLMNQQFPIKSQFVSKLADQLNAEIVLGTVQNVKDALHWLSYTYFCICMAHNPTLYGLSSDDSESRADLVYSAATILDKNNLVKYDTESGNLYSTDLGRIASYYYITHGTIATYNEHLKPTMSDIELCRLFSISKEFKHVTVREDEEKELADLLDCVPIPINENLEEPSAKINVLLQTYISRRKLQGLSLTSDMEFITQSANRLMRALFEICLKRGWAQSGERALNMCKMINKRIWSVQTPLRQFHLLQNDILMELEKQDLTWERYHDLSSLELEELVSTPTLGMDLHRCIHQIPKLNLSAHFQPILDTILRVELTVTPDFLWEDAIHGSVEPFWIIVEDANGENIFHNEYFLLKKQFHDEPHTLIFTVPVSAPLPSLYFIKVVSDIWLGSLSILTVPKLPFPRTCPPPTELMNLQPLPVTALRNPLYESFYHNFKHFNSIQTQAFTVLYNTDDCVLVAAPTGSGKTICAEFAILRNHQKGSDSVMRVVYITPFPALAEERYKEWKIKFGDKMGLKVCKLTGETAVDLELLEKGHVIISTPDRWDPLSRCWRELTPVQPVSLFIVDELELIGGPGPPVLEVIISRMRYVAANKNIRIVGLSTSVANAVDLGNWIGAKSHSIFNFSPDVRPVPLDTQIYSIDIPSFEARMQAMSKPTYTAILQHAKNKKPAIVFAPTRKHTCLTAVDLMKYSSAENKYSEQPLFLLKSGNELDALIDSILEPVLKKTLRYGVGFLHEGLLTTDQDIVKEIFERGCIQVCVMSATMCWGISLSAHLVVVMGTQYYDFREKEHVDYPLTDLLRMMGHAGRRPLDDNSAKGVIFCPAPRKEYYKKFLAEAFPVESALQNHLHDILNIEVAAKSITTENGARAYLTWTFMCWRFSRNPYYYGCHSVRESDFTEHRNTLAENTLSNLESWDCIVIDGNEVSPTNLGKIASCYHISYTTIKLFSSSITRETNLKDLLDILTSASEYEQLLVCTGQEDLIRELVKKQRFLSENPNYADPHVKANALLQAHFSRYSVDGNLVSDQQEVLLTARRLLEVMIDIIASNGWLSLALLAMNVCQMVTQGMWEGDSVLLQLPHVTKELATRYRNIYGLSELLRIEVDKRRELLQMSDSQMTDVARFFSRLPCIKLSFEVVDADYVWPEQVIDLKVTFQTQHSTEVGPVKVISPRYPKDKEERWWLVVGDTKSDELYGIWSVFIRESKKKLLDFTCPNKAGKKSFTLYLISDSYMGCDQKFGFTVDVKAYPDKDTLSDVVCHALSQMIE